MVVVDYKPRRLDVAALRAGNLAEVLNITAWSNVAVKLPHVQLAGIQGWEALGSSLAQRYLNDIASSQVCIWPFRSICTLLEDYIFAF